MLCPCWLGRRLSLCSMNFFRELLTNWTNLPSFVMIRSKAQMLNVMKQCDGANTLTREQKFQVFVNVCDNMLAEGRLSKANHTRWTNIFWSWLKKAAIPLQFRFAKDWKDLMSGFTNPAKCTLMVLFGIITKLSLLRESISENVMLTLSVGIISILKHFLTVFNHEVRSQIVCWWQSLHRRSTSRQQSRCKGYCIGTKSASKSNWN